MNERGVPEDPSWKKPKRQMREGGRGGDASDTQPKLIHAKEVGESDIPARRTLRGVDVPTNSQEITKDVSEKERTTLEQRHPDWPEVTAKFYFAPHETAEDMAGMKDHMEGIDIYFYESLDGDSRVSFWQDISTVNREKFPPEIIDAGIDGMFSYYDFHGGPGEAMCRALYGSNVIVGQMDIRPGDSVTAEQFDALHKIDFYGSTFGEILQNYGENLRNQAQFNEKREDIMTSRLEEELEKIFTNPELKQRFKDKSQVNILITMGSYHTSLVDKFQAEGIATEQNFSQGTSDQEFPYDLQAQRQFLSDREPDQELLAKAYLTHFISPGLRFSITEKIRNNDLVLIYYRQVASHFSLAEIQTFHEEFTDGAGGFNLGDLQQLLNNKRIAPLPRTNEELKAAVERFRQEEEQLEK